MRTGTLIDDDEFVERELRNEPGINLKYLNLNLNRLPNNFAAVLSNTLRVLRLDGNPFGDEFPLGICSLLQLEWLSMQECGLHGRLPYEMKQLSKLRYLDLIINELISSSFDDRNNNNNNNYHNNNDKNNNDNNNNHIIPPGTCLPHSLEELYLSQNSFEDGFTTSI